MERYRTILKSIKSEEVETVRKKIKKKYSSAADDIVSSVVNGTPMQIFIASLAKCKACKADLETNGDAVVDIIKFIEEQS